MVRAFRIVLASLLAFMGGLLSNAQSPADPSGRPATHSSAQPSSLKTIDLAGVGIMDDMADSTFVAFSNSRDLDPAALPSLTFSKDTRKYSQFIPAGLVNATTIMKFTLSNSSDSVQYVFFCPGFLFRRIDLYKMDDSLPGATRGGAAQGVSQGAQQGVSPQVRALLLSIPAR